jgi:acyl-CoA synthetase (NDP forming)
MAARSALARMLRPAALAIVGASDRIGPGLNAWLALRAVGYAGRTYLVNPRRAALFDQPTYPSLDAIPEPLDAVFVAVPGEAVLDAVRQAAARGAAGAAVLSSGFGEAGPAGVEAERELAAIAAAAGMAVCGPNCLGLISFAGSAALWGTTVPDAVRRGGVAVIAQSGSVGIALLNAGRGFGLAYLITSGNEAATTAADYLEVLVDDPDVTCVIAFLEQLRSPARFVAAARRARELGKPVIVVKSGRSERARQAVMAHTGAVAGDDSVVDAACRAAGVIRVGSLDELMEMAALVSAPGPRPAAPGVAVLSPSGGEIALALDVAESARLSLPAVPAAAGEVAKLLPDFAHAGNPLDLTWAGLYDPAIARRCAELMGAEAEVGALVLLQDAPRGLAEQQATRYANLFRAVAEGARSAGKPLAVVSNLATDFHPAYEAVGHEAGVPCLRGTFEGLAAVARYTRWATTTLPPAPPPTTADVIAEARRLLAAAPATRALAEHDARAVLAPYGVRGPREILVADPDAAGPAAAALGFPVAVKGLVEGVVHKTEAGLVRLGLASEAEVVAAGRDLALRAGRAAGRLTGILVQEMVAAVAEVLVGARVDPEFGPIVVVGGGGVLVEVYRDVAVRLAPIAEDEVWEMIAETRASALLAGFRGRPRGDVAALAGTVAALSRFAADLRAEVAEVEINPVAVLAEGRGVSALDCLIVRCAR